MVLEQIIALWVSSDKSAASTKYELFSHENKRIMGEKVAVHMQYLLQLNLFPNIQQ